MKYLSIVLLLIAISCSNEPTSPIQDAPINVTDFGAFELELNTWSPDRLMSYLADDENLVIYFQSTRYSQNKSNKTFETDEFIHRGAILYQYIEDTLAIIGLGKGKITDNYGETKTTIYPDDVYRHISRIDSVEFLDAGVPIYYINYWYTGEFDPDKVFNKSINKILGKKVVE